MAKMNEATGGATDGQKSDSNCQNTIISREESQSYLKKLFGKLQTGTISLCEISKTGKLTPYFFDITNLDAAAQKAASIKNHCYLTMGVLQGKLEKGYSATIN